MRTDREPVLEEHMYGKNVYFLWAVLCAVEARLSS